MENLPQIIENKVFTLIQQQAFEKSSPVNKPFIEAKQSCKFIDLEPSMAIKFLFDEITASILASGKKKELDDAPIKITSQMLYTMLLETQKGITLKEIKKAFRMGLCGEFGDHIGYGIASFSMFIRKYMNYDARENAMKEWLKLQDNPTTEKPCIEIFKESKPVADAFFELYSKELGKRITTIYTDDNNNFFHLPAIYDFLNNFYKISFKEETIDYITTTAKMAYAEFVKKSGLKKSDISGYNNLVDSVKAYSTNDLRNVIMGMHIGENKTLDYYIKAEALKIIFNRLKDTGKTIDSLTKK